MPSIAKTSRLPVCRLLVAVACGLLISCTPDRDPAFGFRVAVVDDGIYRVGYDALGHAGPPPVSSGLRLSVGGQPVTFDLDDGGDGRFGPGDSLTFLGRHLAGENSWFSPWSAENIYLLTTSGKRIPNADAAAGNGSGSAAAGAGLAQVVSRHFEEDAIRVALPGGEGQAAEAWFWKRLSHLDRQPFELDLSSDQPPIGIRVALAGLSEDRAASEAGEPQHKVEVLLGGQVIASRSWDGQGAVELAVGEAALAAALERDLGSAARLGVRVPRRVPGGASSPLIDVVLLNWLEVDYPGNAIPNAASYPGPYGARHYLVEATPRVPEWVEPYRPRGLRAGITPTDYLMIVHGSLRASIEPLAEFHRQRGLQVTVVDVADIYDDFSHGIVTPFALRDFIRHVRAQQEGSALRYVLLVGDASWDARRVSDRPNLVPTLQVQAHDELAASDNGFVAAPDDWRPQLAIGRIPAADSAELDRVVAKILTHAQGATVGAWQQRVALVSDMNPGFQEISTRLGAGLEQRGLVADTVFPAVAEGSAAQDQQQLLDAFEEGRLVVHFLGHGGRFVWRTGPPDLRDSSDLFSVTDVDGLRNRDRLPLVLSMTCSSGPFDHPEAGSIAERFLMMPSGGAVGVLAASWRVSASESFSARLLDALTVPGRSVGEAILDAKRNEPNRALVESYNLLGDPALVLMQGAESPAESAGSGQAGGGNGN